MNTSTLAVAPGTSKGINVALWIAQSLLAAMFLMTGTMKFMMPPQKEFPTALALFIGTAEILGAIGLLLPSITRIKPQLTSLAALGLGIIMILAAIFHFTRHEMSEVGVVLILAALAFFVAWGRYKER